jgi:hypothetical protein
MAEEDRQEVCPLLAASPAPAMQIEQGTPAQMFTCKPAFELAKLLTARTIANVDTHPAAQ